jgi:fumarylpyruvate hydrolase
MSKDLVTLPDPVRIPVLDDADRPVGTFPVGRVFCVGRNYAEHAREMGHDPSREAPFFFMKPASAVTTSSRVRYPAATADLHHEVELVVAVGETVAASGPTAARRAVLACGVGIDLTRRDLQAEAKRQGRPWETAKSFDGSAPCAALRLGAACLEAPETPIRLWVDDALRQDGTLGQMIWLPEEILVRLTELFGLRAGDLVFTGTPAGVGPLLRGERIRAEIEGLPALAFDLV